MQERSSMVSPKKAPVNTAVMCHREANDRGGEKNFGTGEAEIA